MFTKKIIISLQNASNRSERVDTALRVERSALLTLQAPILGTLHLTESQALDLILATDFTIPCNEWHNERRSG